ncbi:hypothetical protein OG21DRAFT_1518305 [Imleria badia]|nr:hypothetical protein OG21DRAFT_1518305 [Imleria badia]
MYSGSIFSNCAAPPAPAPRRPLRHKHHVPLTQSQPRLQPSAFSKSITRCSSLGGGGAPESGQVVTGGDAPAIFADARPVRAYEECGEVFAYGACSAEG